MFLNRFQVATDSLQVEVRDLKKAASLSHSFQTIDQASLIQCYKNNKINYGDPF